MLARALRRTTAAMETGGEECAVGQKADRRVPTLAATCCEAPTPTKGEIAAAAAACTRFRTTSAMSPRERDGVGCTRLEQRELPAQADRHGRGKSKQPPARSAAHVLVRRAADVCRARAPTLKEIQATTVGLWFWTSSSAPRFLTAVRGAGHTSAIRDPWTNGHISCVFAASMRCMSLSCCAAAVTFCRF